MKDLVTNSAPVSYKTPPSEFVNCAHSRDIFSKKEAESWWAENGNRVRAVYNIPAFERTTTSDHPTSSSEEEV